MCFPWRTFHCNQMSSLHTLHVSGHEVMFDQCKPQLWCLRSHTAFYYTYLPKRITSCLYTVTELGGKDVEDLFTAVLSPSTSQPHPSQVPHPHVPGPLPATPGTSMSHPNAGMVLTLFIMVGHPNIFFTS